MRFSEDRLTRFKGRGGAERTIHIWEPSQPRAVIMALHGALAHAGDYVTPALYFRNHDIATVSFDMCGHDGKRRADIPDFDIFLDEAELFLQWVRKNYPGLPIFIMGHSMGGLIATRFGLERLRRSEDIKGFVLSSPYYVNAVKVAPVLQKMWPKRTVNSVARTPSFSSAWWRAVIAASCVNTSVNDGNGTFIPGSSLASNPRYLRDWIR